MNEKEDEVSVSYCNGKITCKNCELIEQITYGDEQYNIFKCANGFFAGTYEQESLDVFETKEAAYWWGLKVYMKEYQRLRKKMQRIEEIIGE